jgi:hypothetical protein
MKCLQNSLSIDFVPALKTPANTAISSLELYQEAWSSFSIFPFLLVAVPGTSVDNLNKLTWKR